MDIMTTHHSVSLDAIFSLNGDWTFSQAGQNSWHAARVPGCNFTDLLANGLIEDPFYRDNESRLQWIEQQDWHYRKSFWLDESWLKAKEQTDQCIELVAEGLDTFCDLYLNGQKIGSSQNMFVGQRISCHSLLKAGENLLELQFRSPIQQTLPAHKAAGFTYPAENDKSEEKLSVYCRKAPCHFGWDWGPRFVTSGIWRPIYLQRLDSVRIADLHYVQHSLNAAEARFSFDLQLQVLAAQKVTLLVECQQAPELNQTLELQLEGSEQLHRLDFSLAEPQLWWPNGLGDAFLYDFSFTVLIDGRKADSRSERIGLRTIEVVNQPDEMGLSFFLKVNDVPVFMKGANYIPGDSFIHQMTPERHQADFAAVAAANMNMLRVWGGGVYQDDEFYKLADQHGILIWQDFMFACTLYPADPAFLDNVRAEAHYNIKRLRNHPCLALWCGNNEVDMAIKHWQWPEKFGYSDELYQRLKQNYIRLFDQCLPQAVQELDTQRFYLRSSPIGFWEDDADHMGNHHFWGVWHGEQPFSEYKKRIPRFMSEFGFQSFPIDASMARFTLPQDWQLSSEVLKVHQKHPRGNALIRSYMQQEYQDPRDFSALLYLSQVQQAEGLKQAFEAHRAAMPFCMGTLYWQLNDTWPAASWSGIDYYGRWKALHYQAKRSFRPDLLVLDEQAGQITVRLISDRQQSLDAELQLELWTFNGHLVWQQQQWVQTPINAAVLLLELDKAMLQADKNVEELVLQVRLTSKDQGLLTDNLYYFVPAKQQKLAAPKLDIRVQVADGLLSLQLCSSALIRQCCIEVDGANGNFSDNFFDLLAGQPKQIQLVMPGLSQSEVRSVAQTLRCRSLYDSYTE
jgi:beta-mannosidase